MRRWLLLLLIVLTASADADVGLPAFLYDSLAGTYIAVGKRPGKNKSYCGTAVIESKQDHIIVTRVINGETFTGVGKIEPSHAERVNVVRVRFKQKEVPFEITYLLGYDLDNYARLSGYVYPLGQKTSNPGLETLFIDHAHAKFD